MDAIAGIIISLFVFTMVYPTLKEASLVLLDSYHSPETMAAIESIANSIKQVRQEMFYAQWANGCLPQLFAGTASGFRPSERRECPTN